MNTCLPDIHFTFICMIVYYYMKLYLEYGNKECMKVRASLKIN